MITFESIGGTWATSRNYWYRSQG